MCVIFVYVNANPEAGGYKLILASNRDEFFTRKTFAAHKWPENNVYGGTDEEPGREGGTWLAISGKGGLVKVGALLNLTGEPKLPNAIGRGMIVTDFVTSFETKNSIYNYNAALMKDCTKYSGFNFLSIELDTSKNTAANISVCSNAPPGLLQYKENDYYGFGNSLPIAPLQKVLYGRKQFQLIVEKFNTNLSTNVDVETLRQELTADLMDMLKSREKCWPDNELHRRAPNWGEYLSSINVHIPHAEYGSRTHTVILLDTNDCLHYYESTLNGVNPISSDDWKNNYFHQPNFSGSQKTKF